MLILKPGGDIFKSPAQTLVVPVNTHGVMGNGLALAFSNRFPGLLIDYRRACALGKILKEGFHVWDSETGKKILCFPTKRKWQFDSRLDWIDLSLEKIALNYKDHGITSLAVPALGCGKGNLKWEDVYPMIKQYLGHLDIDVYVYPPY
jgi:O-acetyl-ADP-ribose deacetylase (regulator of RNase III)